MKLSEELQWRGFVAEHTLDQISDLDKAPRNFYWGTDPSADSLHIGHLAALMMCACFVRHGYTPYYLVGGATGQIGDPKDTVERDLKGLDEIEKNKQDSEIANARKSQVGSGDRSEKIRTYNYPQGRITDHRIGMSIYQMENFLNGDIDEMVDNLIAADRAERLKGEDE